MPSRVRIKSIHIGDRTEGQFNSSMRSFVYETTSDKSLRLCYKKSMVIFAFHLGLVFLFGDSSETGLSLISRPTAVSTVEFKCENCEFQTPTKKSLSDHYKDRHDATNWRHCNQNFNSRKELTSHLLECSNKPSTVNYLRNVHL